MPAGECSFPKVSDEQLRDWLAEFARPAEGALPVIRNVDPAESGDDLLAFISEDDGDDEEVALVVVRALDADGRIRRQAVERELLDLLIDDTNLPRVKEQLARQLEVTTDTDALDRLHRLERLLLPAMAAEIWSGQLATIQHLLVGVPQYPVGMPKATHFDAIDDKVAHCVSGNSLLPGDYPVGVGIPHPEGKRLDGRSSMFHLINLPTPRRRLAFRYEIKRNEAERLNELSKRTVAAIMAEKKIFTENELAMLEQLDPEVFSSFVGPYFQAVADRPIKRGDISLTGQPTLHTAICYMLAQFGTREALPGLEKAIADKRIAPPTPEAPYLMTWIAALAIAEHDPGDETDEWLASLIGRDEPLILTIQPTANLGATAAAMLLRRMDVDIGTFGLQVDPDNFFNRFGLTGFRFMSPEKRDEVLRWWKTHKQQTAATPAS